MVIHRTLDILVVILLLTGQITIRGVFITIDGGFSLSLAGPITGSPRSTAVKEAPQANLFLDAADVIAALLIILDQINVVGTFISSSGHFTIVVSGPFFGEPKRVQYAPKALSFSSDYKDYVLNKFQTKKPLRRK